MPCVIAGLVPAISTVVPEFQESRCPAQGRA
jgi:hypothetical protein